MKHFREALESPRYRAWLGAVAFWHFGNWAMYIAEAWLVYRLSASATILGLLSAFALGPFLVLPVYAGHLVDRFGARRVGLLTRPLNFILILCAAGFFYSDCRSLAFYLALALAQGVFRAIEAPATQVLVLSSLGDRRHLPAAASLNTLLYNLARILGPTVSALIISASNEGAVFLFAAACMLPALVVVALSPKPLEERVSKPLKLKVAFQLLFSHADVRTAAMASFAANMLLVPSSTVLIAFVTESLKGGAATAALLTSAAAPAAVAMSLSTPALMQRMGSHRLLRGTLSVAALSLTALGLSTSLLSAIAASVVLGGFVVPVSIASSARIQEAAPDGTAGRAAAVVSLCTTGAIAAGSLLMGTVAEVVGTASLYVGSGLLCLVLCAWLTRGTGETVTT